MTAILIAAARALCAQAEEYELADGVMLAAPLDLWHALMDAIEAAEKAKPAAYRMEVRWRNRALDQSWRKYSDTAYRNQAIAWQKAANNMETESRIVPLYAGEPEGPR